MGGGGTQGHLRDGEELLRGGDGLLADLVAGGTWGGGKG